MITQTTKPWWKNATIRDITFKTRKELETHIRCIINSAEINVPLSDGDYDFMMDVLQHHPEFVEKSYRAYDIVVRINRGLHFSNRGLWFLRGDDTEVDISWPVALNAEPTSYERLARDAARYAIHPQIQAFRDRGGHTCAICRGAVNRAQTHIDHTPPYTFENLFTRWFGRKVVGLDNTGLHPVFSDHSVSLDWQEFHALFAALQVTHGKCNMSQGAGTRP